MADDGADDGAEPTPDDGQDEGAEEAAAEYENVLDEETGVPTGGSVNKLGIAIEWQDGPAGKDGKNLNGAQVEEVLESGRQRLQFFQESKFACDENADAIRYIGLALSRLADRTARRVREGVEGTNELDSEAKKAQLDKEACAPLPQ